MGAPSTYPMSGGDRYQPLWADPPPEEPDDRAGDVVGWTVEEDEPAPPQGSGRPSRPWLVVALVVLATVSVVAIVTDRSVLAVETVPSAWGSVGMRCETVRIDRDGSAVEAFTCRATGSGKLPPGIYRSPEAQWTSDLTRQDARVNEIRISPAGKVVGWALY